MIAVIPARGGSRRIPRKNVRLFHGQPIIAYSIQAASGLFDGIYVSTEDAEIAEVARQYGALVIDRPPELAEIGAPDCGTQAVTRHALEALGVAESHVCCVYPCAPMLTPSDLYRGYADMREDYSFVPGWYYWGRAEWFRESRPLGTPSDGPSARYVDIDTEADWLLAEQMYLRMMA